jgi:hypothetical protein
MLKIFTETGDLSAPNRIRVPRLWLLRFSQILDSYTSYKNKLNALQLLNFISQKFKTVFQVNAVVLQSTEIKKKNYWP